MAAMNAHEGDLVRITGILPNDPHPLEIGTVGTVVFVDDAGTAHVEWDSGHRLGVLPDDPFEIIQEPSA